MVHLYTGNGAGKTTAAIGLIVRAAGYGKKAVFVQFLKGAESGEVEPLKKLGAVVLRNSRDYGFFKFMADDLKAKVVAENDENLNRAIGLASSGEVTLVVLDEILDAINLGAIDIKAAEDFICGSKAEIVVTGRNPSERIKNRADYYTEMVKVRHPFDKGEEAREGIEF
jgi:ATP:corrinoid adenosyltransferase